MLLPLFALARVQVVEIDVGHIDFAAHLQHVWRIRQGLWNVTNRKGIVGDILAGFAITARCGINQSAFFVPQRQRHADLMPDLGKGLRHGRADLVCRAVGQLQVGKPRLDRHVALFQRVVFGIADRRRVLYVVFPIGGLQFGFQAF